VDPSYSRRLRQITRSEWELANDRIRLNTPGDCIYVTRTLRSLVGDCALHTGMKCVTMDENKSRIFDLFDRTAVGVVEDDIISNRQSGHCQWGSSSKGSIEYFTA